MDKLINTSPNIAITVARLTLGLVIFPHGAQKLLGWFGGFGYSGTMGFMTETMGLPYLIGFLVIIIEFFGSLALIAGFLSRVAALGIAFVMAGAAITVHWQNGFFMTGSEGVGYEFHLLAIGVAIAIMIAGSGAASVDGVLSAKSSQAS